MGRESNGRSEERGVRSETQMVNGYRDLKVWQLGVEISLEVYRLSEKFPQWEIYGLSSQVRRAAVSIPSNIAEGHSRGQTKDLLRFLSMARGSIAELETQLNIAERLGYVQKADLTRIAQMLDEEGRMLAGLRRSLRTKLGR
jgi:four helix bundle protein